MYCLQVQIDMRKSTEKYRRACLARDRACELLKHIENLKPAQTAPETFDPERQDELNRTTEEVEFLFHCVTSLKPV